MAEALTLYEAGNSAYNGPIRKMSTSVANDVEEKTIQSAIRAAIHGEKLVRESLITLVVIVSSYLSCNLCYVLLTILEYNAHPLVVDPDTGAQTPTQIAIADTITFMFMLLHLR